MPTVSAKQERFMQAVAHNSDFAKKVGVPQSVGKEFTRKDAEPYKKAAGIMFVTPDNQVLLLKRGNGSDHPGEWCFPGGTNEDDETIEETAERETIEELGFLPKGHKKLLTRRIADGVDYTTFIQMVPDQFMPKLNGEHTGFLWVNISETKDGEKRVDSIRADKAEQIELDILLRIDSDFNESDHPRNESGKFTVKGEAHSHKEKVEGYLNPSTSDVARMMQASGPTGSRNLRAMEHEGDLAIWPAEDMLHGTMEERFNLDPRKTKRYIFYGKEKGDFSRHPFRAGRFGVKVNYGKADWDDDVVFGNKPTTNDVEIKPEDASDLIKRALRIANEPIRADEADFIESEHPRDEDGKFTEGSGTSSSKGSVTSGMKSTIREGKTLLQSNGQPLPDHIKKLTIPPAWTNVQFAENPNAKLLVIGRDAKNRRQPIYSLEHHAQSAQDKFERVDAMMKQFNTITGQIENGMKSDDMKTRDAASCVDLIRKMGVRPGSDDDTGAKIKAYGATTLEGRHIVEDDDGKVSLQFVGKKGVSLNLPVDDQELATNLLARKREFGEAGKLFPLINEKSLLAYTHTLGDGSFKTKDFRTQVGTSTALKLVSNETPPKDFKEYKKKIMDVAKVVSKKLGNTPTIALAAYISPVVFSSWRMAVGDEMNTDAKRADDDNDKETDETISLPEAHFIGASTGHSNDEVDDETDDDEEIPTPEDVIAILGFDPADEIDEKNDDDLNRADSTIPEFRNMMLSIDMFLLEHRI